MRRWQRIIYWQQVPFLYRTHETPEGDKIRALAAFIANFGYGIRGVSEEIHPKELQKLLARIAGTPEEPMISRMALRSMKQAAYTTGLQWALWAGGEILLPLYISDPALSGSADPSDYQGGAARTE